MLFDRGKIKVYLYINYGNDEIRHQNVSLAPGSSVLDALEKVADLEVTPDESATGHEGSMVTSIDGHRNDLEHCWIYYVFERGDSGWRIPLEMPDRLEVTEGMRVGWRYCDMVKTGNRPVDGPLWTTRCVSKTRTCSRQF